MTQRVQFMCTAFRDGFQSAYGARVQTRDFLPALEAARDAGIQYFEAGGGARFQSLYFYCNEDAFEMMDTFRETVGPDANLQTLARGVNVVGLESQSSDVIDLHAKLFKKHGITTIRNFDALNDVENLAFSGQCIVDHGLKHQVCVTLMELPPGCEGAHDADFYVQKVREILDAEIPFDSICFKDASGTSVPATVHETVRRARKILPEGTFIHYHTHDTAGIGVAGNQAAIEGGADAIDLSLAPCSGGTCQTDVLVMWHVLRGTGFDLGVDVTKIREVEETFKECMKDYFMPPEALTVEPLIPWSPMPGGALTANTQMLRDNGIMDRYEEIIKAMGEVVQRGGFGTSVTPVSQFYFQQAFNNVMFSPWEKIARDYGLMVLGYYGRTPVAPDPEIVDLASAQLELEPTTRSPREMNDEDPSKGLGPARKRLEDAGIEVTEENLFIAATCKEKGVAFLKGEATLGVRKVEAPVPATPAADEGSDYVVTVNGKDYRMSIRDGTATVDGRPYNVDIRADDASSPVATASGDVTEVAAQMPGTVLRIVAEVGSQVAVGDPILVLEAMKMEMDIKSSVAGTIRSVSVSPGDQVATGQIMAVVG